ncbi:MAG: GHKL domain-containing protein [Eubacteriales bacterium]|nr:GHKL domain-containing protein [Eubacteriales bacterium]
MENRMLRDYMKSTQELYESIEERTEAMRRYRHDLVKHIRTLEAMLERETDMEGIQLYVDNLKHQYEDLCSQDCCGDEVVNAILAVKRQQCERKRILLEVQVENGDYGGIRELDLVALLQNLLDNAVEAQERIGEPEKKKISFRMSAEPEGIHIFVRNQIPDGERPEFRSGKKQREEHGFGRRIISSIVKKYHGEDRMLWDEETRCYTEELWLKNAD